MSAAPDFLEPSVVPVMLDHVTIVSDDFDADRVLYDAVAGALGMSATVEYGDPEEEDGDSQVVAAIGYAAPNRLPLVWLVAGSPATRGAHIALGTHDRSAVEAVHRAAIGAGARVVQAPRAWEERQLDYFGVQVADRNGSLIEVVHRPSPPGA